MKKLISILVTVMFIYILNGQDNNINIYQLLAGKNSLVHVEKKISKVETINTYFHKGRKYEILLSSVENITVTIDKTKLELEGKKVKSLVIVGNDTNVIIKISPSRKKQKIVIGICYILQGYVPYNTIKDTINDYFINLTS